MKKIGAKILLLISLTIVFFSIGSSEVSANGMNKIEVEYRLYTDIANVDEDTAKGGYVSATSSFLVEYNEVWQGDYYVSNKLQKMGEEILKKQIGQNVSVAGMIKSNDTPNGFYWNRQTYLKSNSMNMIRYGHLEDRIQKVQLRFPGTNVSGRKLIVNLFGSLNGPLNGWKVYSGAERYYNNNDYHTGLHKVGQTTYLFTSNGAKQYGWHKVNGWEMYFNKQNGGLWTGKRKIGHTTYLFNSQGHKIDGWHRLDGKDYYFNQQNGGMWTGKRKIGHTTYLFHNEGHKIYGWYVNGYGQKSYFDPAYGGGLVTGFRKVGNAYYYFDTNTGNARTRYSRNINGQRWYFNSNGIGSIER